MRKLIDRCWVGLLLWLALLTPSHGALAHADLDQADPAIDAVLTTAPSQVQLWFTQELFRRQGLNTIEVYGADGSRQDQGDAAINDDDRTLLAVALKPDLPAGLYTVRWQAVSAEDGHESAGEFTFTIATGTATVSSATVITATGAAATGITDTTTPVAATPTPPPTAAATPTVAAPTAMPPRSTGTGMPCLGGAAPLLLVVGVLWLSRRRTIPGPA